MVRTRSSNQTPFYKRSANRVTGRGTINSKNVRNQRGALHRAYYCPSRPHLRLNPRSRTSLFATGTPQTVTKPLAPIISTKEQCWNAFYSNGRLINGKYDRIYHNSCTLFCEASFVDSEQHSFWTKSSSNESEPHAEIKALREIGKVEKTHFAVRKVDMLLTYSPCAGCARAIINFKSQRRHLQTISLAFTAIYQHELEEHRQGLQNLASEPGINLRIFTENDWIRLAKETDKNYHSNKSRKLQDEFWNRRLQEILKGEVVIDVGKYVDSTMPHTGPSSGSSRKLECCMGITLVLVVVFVIAAVVSQLVK